MVKVSVIIPCYNQGEYLLEALDSLKVAGLDDEFEIIIINDGSNDKKTLSIFSDLESEGYHVLHKLNGGLSSARNEGIAIARGNYILLLDSDNKILIPYLKEAVGILDSNLNVSVVYGNPVFFGDKSGIHRVGDFNLQRLMLANYIDACALVRKSIFDKVGLYDENLKFGLEDWEMWLRIAFEGGQFYYLDMACYHYRIRFNSMSREIGRDYSKINFTENYINEKHARFMGHSWIVENFIMRFKKSPVKILIKIFLKAYFPKYYNKLLSANKIKNGI